MANKTIQELDAIELADNDLLPVWDTSDGRTKKSAISEMKQKIVGTVDNAATPESNNLITSGAVAAACSYCASDNTTVTGPALFNGAVVKIMFTSAITGSDTTTPLAINYNGTSYNVKATSNGSLKNFTATPIKTETREQTRGKSEEESETKGGEGTRATTTTYVYCQAYTTLELMFDGTQFIIMGNPVVISSADFTIYTDGSKTNKYYFKSGEVVRANYTWKFPIKSNSLYYCVFGANGNHSTSAIIGTPKVYSVTEVAIFSVNIPSGSNFGTLSGVIENGYLVLSVPNGSMYVLNYIELS